MLSSLYKVNLTCNVFIPYVWFALSFGFPTQHFEFIHSTMTPFHLVLHSNHSYVIINFMLRKVWIVLVTYLCYKIWSYGCIYYMVNNRLYVLCMEIILFLTLPSMLNYVWLFLGVVTMYLDTTSILEYEFSNIKYPSILQHGSKDNGLRCSMLPTSLMQVLDALKKSYFFSGLVRGL